jgi:hypothetical protein
MLCCGQDTAMMLPLLKMDLELIDVGRNVCAVCIGGKDSLLHAKHGRRKGRNALFLKVSACLDALPGGGNLDAKSVGV